MQQNWDWLAVFEMQTVSTTIIYQWIWTSCWQYPSIWPAFSHRWCCILLWWIQHQIQLWWFHGQQCIHPQCIIHCCHCWLWFFHAIFQLLVLRFWCGWSNFTILSSSWVSYWRFHQYELATSCFFLKVFLQGHPSWLLLPSSVCN